MQQSRPSEKGRKFRKAGGTASHALRRHTFLPLPAFFR